MEFKRIRQAQEERLGDSFSLPDFHAAMLACKGPLFLLEECTENKLKGEFAIKEE